MTEVEEYLNQLKDLRAKRDELAESCKQQRRDAAVKLHSMLNDLNQGPLPLLELQEGEMVDINDYSCFKDKSWEIREIIRFVNQDPNKVGYDFGSSFDLYITDKNVEINHGCIGQWGLKNKGQWSRLLLMRNIFLHEEDIVRELNKIIDIKMFREFDSIRSKITNLTDKLEYIEQKEKEDEILKELKSAKYLATKGVNWDYAKKEDGSYDYSADMIKRYFWYNIIKIEKITDVSIIGYECTDEGSPWTWSTRRLKLKDTLRKIRNKELYLVDDISIAPQPEGDSK